MRPGGRDKVGVVATVATLCLTLAVAGWWLSRRGSAPARHSTIGATAASEGAAVPWVDRPASPPPAPTPSPQPTPAPAYPACTSRQLAAKAVGGGAAAGNLEGRVQLTNTSTTACSLFGYPTSFDGVRSDGAVQRVDARHGTFFDVAGYWPADLQPFQSGWLIIGTADGCEALNQPAPQGDPFAGEVIGLPGGGTIRASETFDPSCGLGISELGTPAPAPSDALSSLPGLTMTMNRPATAPAGSLLRYTVTLTNTSADRIDLSPCPIYTQAIYTTQDASTHGSYQLNCDKITSINPDDSVTYAMQIAVPDRAGIAKFIWTIPAASIGGGGTITITQPS